jgi:hypothetical protein
LHFSRATRAAALLLFKPATVFCISCIFCYPFNRAKQKRLLFPLDNNAYAALYGKFATAKFLLQKKKALCPGSTIAA